MIHPLSLVVLILVGLLVTVRADAASGYPYQSCFELASRMHHVPMDVLLAVAETESGWNPDARSSANAHGIMQIQWPDTARHLGITRVAELYNPCLNIELGARYLRELLDASGGDLSRALAAYNYGPSRIASEKALPAGAVRYLGRVNGARERIRHRRGGHPEVAARSDGAADAVMRFDRSVRARRYADTLNSRLSTARFTWRPAQGGYVVSMQVAPEGLSFRDALLLETLGWPGTGEAGGRDGGGQ